MDASPLMRLPIELQEMIISYITRLLDLKTLCLVSRKVSSKAISQLYRDISLPYRPEDNQWKRVILLSQSRQLQHVRSINIGQSDVQGHVFCEALYPLLITLPANTLKRFEWSGRGRPTPNGQTYLWETQKQLQNLQLDFYYYAPSIKEMLRSQKAELQSLHDVVELSINFAGVTNEDLVHSLFDMLGLKALRKIKLASLPDYRDTVNGATFGESFYLKFLPRTLTHITLFYMNLPAAEHWNLSEYYHLSHLEFYDCRNVGSILASFTQPTLKHLSLGYGSNEDLDYSVAAFLGRFGSLENLTLAKWGVSGPTMGYGYLAESIASHRGSLKSLILAIEEFSTPLFDATLCCLKIQELALTLETTELPVHCKILSKHLPDLELLNVFHHRHDELWRLASTNDFEYKIHTLELANKAFAELSAASHLKLLAFGKKIEYGDRLQALSSRGIPQQQYVRAKEDLSSDSEGLKAYAARLEPGMEHDLVSKSNVLRYRFLAD